MVVIRMKGKRDIVSSIVKTTQMGQIGIRCVLNAAIKPKLRETLQSQLREYDTIERQAQCVAASNGFDIKELDPMIKHSVNAMVKAKLRFGNVDSKAAAMMIKGNMQGIIKGYKNLNQFTAADDEITTLAKKLLDCEKENIQQMQRFL